MFAGLICKVVAIEAVRRVIVKHLTDKKLDSKEIQDEMFNRKAEELKRKFANY